MIVACVLRSGGEYTSEHVARLRDGVGRHLRGARFICFSDVDVPCDRVPLEKNYPGWWSKLEIFRPEVEGDFLYLDLDSIVVGDLTEMANDPGPTIMRDVYRHDGLQSSVMKITQEIKPAIWKFWLRGPQVWMNTLKRGGDQAFLERCGVAWRLWQEVLPGRVVSYKVDWKAHPRPANAAVVAFHGKPKMWHLPNDDPLYREWVGECEPAI